jgi:hypothetical protein
MSVATRKPQAPESYATFWEPVGTGTPTVEPPADTRSGAAPEDAKDAYLEFANVTEGPPVARVKPA